MLTVVRSEPPPRARPAVQRIDGASPALRTSHRPPRPGPRSVASDAGVTAELSAMAWVSDDGRWWVCRERATPSQFAELVALAAAVSHHPGRRLRMLTDLEALAGLVSGWRAGGVHRWPSLLRHRDPRLERIVAVLQRHVAERAGRGDEVTAAHVRGHSGHPLNTAADRLARHALTTRRIDPRRCQEIVDHHLGRDPGAVGHPGSRLVVLCGGTASDRVRVASEVRRRYGPGCALVAQDDVSHLVLGERDEHSGALIAQIAAFALDAGQHVVCEGPFRTARDRRALIDLADHHQGTATVFDLGGAPGLTLSDAHERVVHRRADTDHAVEQILGELDAETERTSSRTFPCRRDALPPSGSTP